MHIIMEDFFYEINSIIQRLTILLWLNIDLNPMRTVIEYLPLGYLYLLILGIASDSIYYGLIGIDIMNYSDLQDVLLSPVIHLTDNPIMPVVVILLPLISYFYMKLIQVLNAKKSGIKKPTFLDSMSLSHQWIAILSIMLFFLFIGLSVGKGISINKNIASGEFNYNRKITFQNDQVLDVKLLGNTSAYLFYITKDHSEISIVPISGNIKKMEVLRKQKSQ